MKLHVELIFMWKVLHFDSFWNRFPKIKGHKSYTNFTSIFVKSCLFLKKKSKVALYLITKK